MLNLKKQIGLSLIELLIGILIGMIVVATAIKIFTGSAQNSQEMTQNNRLDRDLRSMMDRMTHEIKRAGYATSSADVNTLQTNPFALINIEDVSIKTTLHENACITFTYNKDSDNPPYVVDYNERFGFKLALDTTFNPDKQLLRMWKGGVDLACNNLNWETITSPEVEITELNFDLNETKLNVDHKIDPDRFPSTNCNPTNKCLIIRTVTITLSGILRKNGGNGDPLLETEQTITDTVKIRNDQYCHNGVVDESKKPTQCNNP